MCLNGHPREELVQEPFAMELHDTALVEHPQDALRGFDDSKEVRCRVGHCYHPSKVEGGVLMLVRVSGVSSSNMDMLRCRNLGYSAGGLKKDIPLTFFRNCKPNASVTRLAKQVT